MDSAISTSPAVQTQLDRVAALSPGRDVLGLARITALLAALGNPEQRLPPVLHVAGTNGKGSTCAFLRAILEASGHRVHAYTSPHLVRFNERIRLAGTLIEDDSLAALLAQVLDTTETLAPDLAPSFFEATTAAAFLAFARTSADACVIEVGLGGRLDATNVIPAPVVCGITALAIDHREFLLAPESGTPAGPLARIAFEKAGIARAGVPLVTQSYPRAMTDAIAIVAGASVIARGVAWDAAIVGDRLVYRDKAGTRHLPLPQLAGAHQADNAALAVAMLRHQASLNIPDQAFGQGIASAEWPARLQRLDPGPLCDLLPPTTQLYLDGGHNPSAANAIANFLHNRGPATMILGLLANKDLGGFLDALGSTVAHIVAVPVPNHAHHAPQAIVSTARKRGIAASFVADVKAALGAIAHANPPATVIISGSLYLAGEVLRTNDQRPN